MKTVKFKSSIRKRTPSTKNINPHNTLLTICPTSEVNEIENKEKVYPKGLKGLKVFFLN